MSSKKFLTISFLLSFCIFSSVTKASEQLLATITTNVNNDSYQFAVDANDDEHMLNTFYIDTFINGKLSNRDTLPIGNFINERLSFPKDSKYSFVKIYSQNFDRELGGFIIIDTLYNAISGKRKVYEFQLAQDNDGWKLFYNGKTITKILAIANKIPIVGIVGARDLSMK